MELSVRRLFFVGWRRALRVALAGFTTFQIKQKLQCHYNTGVLGGRGWITQAAHLKRPRRGLFAAGTYGARPYELRLPIFLQPLGGALKNRSAAPASPPCFRRRRRSAPLLFESTRPCESDVCAKENRQRRDTLAVFSWARVDYASRAAKNSLAGCFCPAGRKAPGRSCSNPP